MRRMIDRMNRRDWLFYGLMLAAFLPAAFHIVNNRAVNGLLIIIFGIGLGSVVRYLMIMDPKRDPPEDDINYQ
jgi:hypothetical protein